MDAFPQDMRAAMDASIGELKESLVAIATDSLTDVDIFHRELVQAVIPFSSKRPYIGRVHHHE